MPTLIDDLLIGFRLLLGLLAFALVAVVCSTDPGLPERAVPAMRSTAPPLHQAAPLPSVLQVVNVFSPVSGRVARVRVRPGDHVDRNDALAEIESPDIGAATSELVKAKAEVLAAERDLARQQELHRLECSSQRDVEAATEAYRTAKAELERAHAKAALLHLGGAVGDVYILRAHVTGRLASVDAFPGMEVAGQYSGAVAPSLFAIETDQAHLASGRVGAK
jgi:multidrug efflux pump subunit AcrA (membrane-fusion protein)